MMDYGNSEMQQREQALEDVILRAAQAGMPPNDVVELRRLELGPNNEGFAVVSTFQWLEHVYWDHRNMAYIFRSKVLVVELSKATAQQRLHWGTYLGQFDYHIVRIPGTENC